MSTTHSKLKNTSILFELLIRKLTSEILSEKKITAYSIIQEHFNAKTVLSKELKLYHTLLKEKLKKEDLANILIDKVTNARLALNNQKLREERYNLIKTIKEIYELNDFLKLRVNSYDVHAAIYKLFEDAINCSIEPIDVVKSRLNVLEHITNVSDKKVNVQSSEAMLKYEKLNENTRLIAYKKLIQHFNEKYKSLNKSQKILLKEYLNNFSDVVKLKIFVEKEVVKVNEELVKHIGVVKDKALKIKLSEISKQLPIKFDVKIIKESHVLTLMKYYELIKELKEL